VVKSIAKLRNICQETRETEFYQMGWVEKNVIRKISMYFTWLFLKAGISANKVTMMSLFIVLIAGILLTCANPRYWLVGILLSFVFFVFDCVDGEISRYKKSSSLGGQYLDGIAGQVRIPYILACMTFGIYNSLLNPIVFIFGFIAVLAVTLSMGEHLYLVIIAYRRGLLLYTRSGPKIGKELTIIRYTRTPYNVFFNTPYFGFLPQYFMMAIIDIYIHPFTMASIDFNARFIYLIALGTALAISFVLVTYQNTVRYRGVKP